ncbi:MAG TPA: cytochrome c [Candidatus Baltobacteraceae bacterium]|nr:cytochrome c [Candidatus Baltobacteraceae bacterium]
MKLKAEFLSRVGVGSRPAGSGRTFARGMSVACLGMMALLLAGCRLDMHIQPKYLPYEPTDFFSDGRSERQPVPGTVARGQLRVDELLYSGTENGVESNRFPFPITRADLERGRERYNVYCTPCHDYTGSGRGMIVQRGFPQPPSYHIQRLRDAPVGHFYAVMTNGFGAMYSYAARIEPADRWRIAAYIRVLQLSENAKVDDVPQEDRAKLAAQPVEGSAQQPAAKASGQSE